MQRPADFTIKVRRGAGIAAAVSGSRSRVSSEQSGAGAPHELAYVAFLEGTKLAQPLESAIVGVTSG